MVAKILCLALLSVAFCHMAFADVHVPMPPTYYAAPPKTFVQKVKDFIAEIMRLITVMIRRIGTEIKNVLDRPGSITEIIKRIWERVIQVIIEIKDYAVELIAPRVKTLAVTAVDEAAKSAFKLGDKFIEKDPKYQQISKDFDDLEGEEPEP